MLFEICTAALQIMARPEDIKIIAKCKNSLYQVLLVPSPSFFHNLLLRIVGREKNVMDVDEHTRGQPWYHAQVQKSYIIACFDFVAGIDKQNIAFRQPLEQAIILRRLYALAVNNICERRREIVIVEGVRHVVARSVPEVVENRDS